MEKEYLCLKWGTLKAWNFNNPEIIKLKRKYNEIGSCASVMLQKDTPEQKEIICKIIDLLDGEIENDWTGEIMTKDEAKKYITKYK